MKIVHISDLHFPVPLKLHKLRKKSLVGYINYSLRRKKKHRYYLELIQKIQSLDYDCLVLSGDITNVSEREEFQEARKILDPILDSRAFLVPGNHDRYTKEAQEAKLFEETFSEFLGDPLPGFHSPNRYIRYKVFQDICLVGWDSNKPLPLLDAHGFLEPEIPERTIQFLNESNFQKYMIVCHHPIWNPENRQESPSHRLSNREEILEKLKSHPPLCYFHGHLHTNWMKEPDPLVPFYVVNSASSTRTSDETHDSGFHVLDWDPTGYLKAYKRYTFLEEAGMFSETESIVYRGSYAKP